MEWQKETGNIDETTESEKTRDFGILLSRFVRFFCVCFLILFRFVWCDQMARTERLLVQHVGDIRDIQVNSLNARYLSL